MNHDRQPGGAPGPEGPRPAPGGSPAADEVRTRLLALRGELRAELAATEAALVNIRRLRINRVDDDEHDPEGAPLSAEWSRLEGLRRVARERVGTVDDALTRLDSGTYGSCSRCGAPIAAGRLEVLPTATRCVSCADRGR